MPEELDRALATHQFEEGNYYHGIGWIVDGAPLISMAKLEGAEKAAFLREKGGKTNEAASADKVRCLKS
jgi:hypothetical protein